MFVELEQLKQQTGAVRSRLDNFDLQLWKPLTKSTNPTKNIVGAVWRSCNPEMCTSDPAQILGDHQCADDLENSPGTVTSDSVSRIDGNEPA